MSGPYGEQFDQARAWEHYVKYELYARRLGLTPLEQIVQGITDAETIRYHLKEYGAKHGQSLNSIPLTSWDRRHEMLLNLLRHAGGGFWSLSYTVCTLKHVALYYVAGLLPPPKVHDELSATRLAEIGNELKVENPEAL